jgi:hypothetical protein
MRRPRALATLLIAALLPCAAAGAATLYVNRVVVAAPGDVRVADLVRAPGAAGAGAQEALARSVGVLADHVLYVPSAAWRADLEAALGPGAIIVGSRTAVIPRGSLAEGAPWLVDRLVDWLAAQGVLAEAPVEIAVAQVTLRGAVNDVTQPYFQLSRGARGTIDVSATGASSAGGSVSARFIVASSAAPPGSPRDAVTPGTTVNVVFRRGTVTVEMPGRASGAASVGERVAVVVAETQKSFTGTLLEGKAVDVVLP